MVHIPLLLIHPPTSVSIYSTDILGDSAVCLCALNGAVENAEDNVTYLPVPRAFRKS